MSQYFKMFMVLSSWDLLVPQKNHRPKLKDESWKRQPNSWFCLGMSKWHKGTSDWPVPTDIHMDKMGLRLLLCSWAVFLVSHRRSRRGSWGRNYSTLLMDKECNSVYYINTTNFMEIKWLSGVNSVLWLPLTNIYLHHHNVYKQD